MITRKFAFRAGLALSVAALLGVGATAMMKRHAHAQGGPFGYESHHRGGHHGWRGRHHGPDHRGLMMGRILMDRYDADGDRRLTQEEIDTGRQAQHERFDADGDAALTLEEFEALWLDATRQRMVRRFQRHDRDGDGRVTQEEFRRTLRDFVEFADRNADGALSIDDARRERRHGHGHRRGPEPAPAPAQPAE